MFKAVAEFVHKIGILHGIAVLVLLIASTTVLINRGGSIVTLIAGSAASIGETVLYVTPHSSSTLNVGDTTEVDIRINTKTPVNTIGAIIGFSSETIEIVGISKEKSFLDLWTEETTISEKSGEVYFSGGTTDKGGLSGIGTIVTLKVRAKKAGKAEISFKSAQIFPADGSGREVANQKRTFAFTIPDSDKVAASGGSRMNTETLPPPSIDFNDDGRINVVDLSIIAVGIIAPYNSKFDLDRDGANTIADLSIFFTRMRQ